jgi:hypothetical protein
VLLLPRAVEHRPKLLRLRLQATKGLLDVAGFDRRAALAGHAKEAALRHLALLGPRSVARPLPELVLVVLDLERLLGERLHHLKRQEAENVDNVVRRLAVRDLAEARPLPEALALAVRERGLPEFRPRHVLLARHDLGALVGLAQPLQRDVVHLFLLLVLLIVALGHLDSEEGGRLPRQADAGLLVLLGCVVDRAAGHHPAAGVLAGAKVGVAALVVRVLDILADVLPREKCAESRDLGRVVANLEDEVVDGDGARSAPRRKLGATSELVTVLVDSRCQRHSRVNLQSQPPAGAQCPQ